MAPTERILTALADRNLDPKQTGKGWSARCPAHDDRRPSLSISEGDGGRALVHCHAGCDIGAICEAIGLKPTDLMPANGVDTDKTSNQSKKSRVSSTSTTDKTYPTADAAVKTLEHQHGQRSAEWTYHDAQGEPIGVVVRWNMSDGKVIRPVTRQGHQWIVGGMPDPRPLYGLPNLANAERVYVCEGEKAADAARSIGLVATTSAHGSKSANKTDWSPLAGKEIVLLPDNDTAGEAYADEVARILGNLTPPPSSIKILELLNLPEGGDIVEWVEQHGDAAEPESMVSEINSLIEEAEPLRVKRRTTSIQPFQPFPTNALPTTSRMLVEAGATALGCDPSYIALPLISLLGSVVGNRRRIELKRGWCEPCVFWTVVVGESGTLKSPAHDLAQSFLDAPEADAYAKFQKEKEIYDRDMKIYKADERKWQNERNSKKSTDEPPPEPPEEPKCKRYIVSDTTLEALADRLADNPFGLLMAMDELAGWFRSFDKYRNGQGGDCQSWLSMHRAGTIRVDRKSAQRPTLRIEHAAVSICGGIQPGILWSCIGREHAQDGLLARLLLAFPPPRQKRWNENTVSESARASVAKLVQDLLSLEMTKDEWGNPQPDDLPLTADAQDAWVQFYNEHNKRAAGYTGDLAACASKMEGYAARLALLCQLAEDPRSTSVGLQAVHRGIVLANWFQAEAERIYALQYEGSEDLERRELVELIASKGGSISARDLMRSSSGKWNTSAEAEEDLDDLAKEGFGRWQPQPSTGKGGRPTRLFTLFDVTDVDTTFTGPDENDSSVNVDGGDEHEVDWGEV